MTSNLQNKSLNNLFYSRFNISKRINHYLFEKYNNFIYSYSLICTNNLISNEKCQIVARFKDFLIYDDNTEFLHEFCIKKNLFSKLKYIFNFYNTYSRIYPNYIIIPENKFLYKNLRKKQKVIDELNAIKIKEINDNKLEQTQKLSFLQEEKKFFNKSIVDSINRLNISSNMNSTKKNKTNSYSKTFNNIVSSITSEIKGSNKLNVRTKPCNLFFGLKNDFEDMNKNNIYENNDKTLNTQSSSIRLNNFYDENTKSKASLTEIINLINGEKKKIKNKNKNKKNYLKNVSYEKFSKEKTDKFKNIKKNKLKFLILDVDYIKKNIKSHKNKIYYFNNVKTEISKSTTPSVQIEEINKKKNYLKNYHQKSVLNNNLSINNNINDIKNKNNGFHKQTASCLEDEVSEIKKIKNKIQKSHQLKILPKLYSNKIKLNDNYTNFLAIKTVTNFGNRKNKINDLKNYNNNYSSIKYKSRSKKKNNKNNKNPIFYSSISTNSTINFGNTYSKININNNNNVKQIIDYQNFNETKETNNKKKNKYKLMKSLETLLNLGERNIKTNNKERDIKKGSKYEVDSIQSTTVSNNNKKDKHKKLTYTDKLLTQIKRAIKNKNTNKSQKLNLNNNTLTSFSKKSNNNKNNSNKHFNLNFPSDKVNSYECKPLSDYYLNNIYFANIKLKKQRTSTLIKNNIIFNFFTSKDFYNLKIKNNNIYYMKNQQNKNLTKINQTHAIDTKKSISLNEKTKLKKDIYLNDSNSFLLKSFHKENETNNCNNIMLDNKSKISKIYKLSFKYFNLSKMKNNYHKNLCNNNNISNHISNEKSETLYKFKNLHKKNKTTNIICKNKEIFKKNKIKKQKLHNHKRNKITILNNLNNLNFQLYFKTPSKTVIKSLDLNANNKNENNSYIKNNGIIKDKNNMKNYFFDIKKVKK